MLLPYTDYTPTNAGRTYKYTTFQRTRTRATRDCTILIAIEFILPIITLKSHSWIYFQFLLPQILFCML